MTKKSIGIVDYGMGNLHSVSKALALTGARVFVSDQKNKLTGADLLVLPGVGSFGAAMNNLAKRKLDDFIRGWIDGNKPYFGICLGLQLLFESSEEDKRVEGLSALKGKVIRFRPKHFRKKKDYCVPHMGWNTLDVRKAAPKAIAQALARESFYFVHTYFADPKEKDVIATTTSYGLSFCSAVAKENIFAVQFHPEKSGEAGAHLLKRAVTSLC